VITFQLARSGATIVLLSALPAPDGTQQLRSACRNRRVLAWGTLFGPTNTGDWVTMVLDAANVSYAVLGARHQRPGRPAADLRTPARSR
jgi:hypothetical protein